MRASIMPTESALITTTNHPPTPTHRSAVVESQLEPAEVKALLARGASERDRLDVERVEGLGAAPAPRHEHLPKGKTLVERELERMVSD